MAKLTWVDFERMQRAMFDNPLENPEEIFAWLRATHAMNALYSVAFLRVWVTMERIPRLRIHMIIGLRKYIRDMFGIYMTLGGEYLKELINLIKSLFGLIERSEDV